MRKLDNVVFKDELRGRKIKVEGKKGMLDNEVDFEDEGIKMAPTGQWNPFSRKQKIPSQLYKENYDKIRWDGKEDSDV